LWQFDPLLQIAVTCTVMLFTARLIGSSLPHHDLRRQALLISDLMRDGALIAAYARIYLAVWTRPRDRRPLMMVIAVSLIPVMLLPTMLAGLPGQTAAALIPAVLLLAALNHHQRQRPVRGRLSGFYEPGE